MFPITFSDKSKYRVDELNDLSTIVSEKYAIVWLIYSKWNHVKQLEHMRNFLDAGGHLVLVGGYGYNQVLLTPGGLSKDLEVKTGIQILKETPVGFTEATELRGPRDLNNIEVTKGVASIKTDFYGEGALAVDKSVLDKPMGVRVLGVPHHGNYIWGADQPIRKG